jgi:hypothetical protein
VEVEAADQLIQILSKTQPLLLLQPLSPPSTLVTSNLIAQAKGTINGEMTIKKSIEILFSTFRLAMTALQSSPLYLTFMDMEAMRRANELWRPSISS